MWEMGDRLFTVAGGQHRIGTRRQIIGKRGVVSRGGRGKAGEGEQSEKGKRSGRTGQAEKQWQIGHKYPPIISFVFTPPYGGVSKRGAIATASSCRNKIGRASCRERVCQYV